jgi:hypothetical protein
LVSVSPNHPRQLQLVGKDSVLVENTVSLARPMQRDPGDVREFVRAVDVLHVAEHLHHEHAAVAVEGDRHRLHDLRLAQEQFKAVARRKLEGLQCIPRFDGLHRRLRRKGFGFISRKGSDREKGEKGARRHGGAKRVPGESGEEWGLSSPERVKFFPAAHR